VDGARYVGLGRRIGGPEKSRGGPSNRPGGAPRGRVGAESTEGPVGAGLLCADMEIEDGADVGPDGGEG
jgi:hypothetical protein